MSHAPSLPLLFGSAAPDGTNAGSPPIGPAEPMIRLDPKGGASILSYNVPEPTSYVRTNVIELGFEGDNVFLERKDSHLVIDPAGYNEQIVTDKMYNHFYDPILFMYVRVNTCAPQKLNRNAGGVRC